MKSSLRHRAHILAGEPAGRLGDERVRLAAGGRVQEARDDLGRGQVARDVERAIDVGGPHAQVAQRVEWDAERAAAGAREEAQADQDVAGGAADDLRGGVRTDDRRAPALVPDDVAARVRHDAHVVVGAAHADPEAGDHVTQRAGRPQLAIPGRQVHPQTWSHRASARAKRWLR